MIKKTIFPVKKAILRGGKILGWEEITEFPAVRPETWAKTHDGRIKYEKMVKEFTMLNPGKDDFKVMPFRKGRNYSYKIS